MLHNMEIVSRNGLRTIALGKAYTAVQLLFLNARGAMPQADNGTAMRIRLGADLDEFQSQHEWLFRQVDGSLDVETELYSQPTILVQDLKPGTFVSFDNYTYTNRTLSLTAVGTEFLARGRRVAGLNALNPSVTRNWDPDVFW